MIAVQFAFVIAVVAFSGCTPEQRKPELPVKLLVRTALVGERYVVQFHNESSNRMVLTVSLENRTASRKASGALLLRGGEMTEVGWMKGWKFQGADKVLLVYDGYLPMHCNVP
jgi:hypothetical protein